MDVPLGDTMVSPITPEGRALLEAFVREGKGSTRMRQRADGILLIASGATNKDVARQLGIHWQTAEQWRIRLWGSDPVDPLRMLKDAPRPGRPRGQLSRERFSGSARFPAARLVRQVSVNRVHPDYDPIAGLTSRAEDDALRASIERNGVLVPIAAMTIRSGAQTYRIIDGHRRYRAAQQLGLTHVPVQIHPVLSREQFEILRFHLNDNWKPWTDVEKLAAAQALHEAPA